jgi:hypothetical protein
MSGSVVLDANEIDTMTGFWRVGAVPDTPSGFGKEQEP